MYFIKIIFFACFIGLGVIGYFIIKYKAKNSQNNLINNQPISGEI
jgi:hypothetical protein